MRLYVANLSPKVTEEQLEELFKEYGPVSNIELNRVSSINHTSGTATIDMETTGGIEAVRELNNKPFRNRRIFITALTALSPLQTASQLKRAVKR